MTTAGTHWRHGVLVGLVFAVALAVVASACGTSDRVEAALARSVDPVMLPAEPFLADTTFTTYDKWTNQYQLRYNQQIGENSNFTALQFSAVSVSETGSEGPGDRVVALARQAVGDTNCPVVDEPTGLRLCVHETESYLVREFPGVSADGNTITVVATYFDNPLAAAGDNTADRSRFNPASTEAQVMTHDFVAIETSAAMDHLEVVS